MIIGLTAEQLVEILKTHSQYRNTPLAHDLEYCCKELNPWLLIDENTPKDRELWLYWKSTGHMERAFYNHMCGQDAYPTHYQGLPKAPL